MVPGHAPFVEDVRGCGRAKRDRGGCPGGRAARFPPLAGGNVQRTKGACHANTLDITSEYSSANVPLHEGAGAGNPVGAVRERREGLRRKQSALRRTTASPKHQPITPTNYRYIPSPARRERGRMRVWGWEPRRPSHPPLSVFHQICDIGHSKGQSISVTSPAPKTRELSTTHPFDPPNRKAICNIHTASTDIESHLMIPSI